MDWRGYPVDNLALHLADFAAVFLSGRLDCLLDKIPQPKPNESEVGIVTQLAVLKTSHRMETLIDVWRL
jgi:hypothetical protein